MNEAWKECVVWVFECGGLSIDKRINILSHCSNILKQHFEFITPCSYLLLFIMKDKSEFVSCNDLKSSIKKHFMSIKSLGPILIRPCPLNPSELYILSKNIRERLKLIKEQGRIVLDNDVVCNVLQCINAFIWELLNGAGIEFNQDLPSRVLNHYSCWTRSYHRIKQCDDDSHLRDILVPRIDKIPNVFLNHIIMWCLFILLEVRLIECVVHRQLQWRPGDNVVNDLWDDQLPKPMLTDELRANALSIMYPIDIWVRPVAILS